MTFIMKGYWILSKAFHVSIETVVLFLCLNPFSDELHELHLFIYIEPFMLSGMTPT